MKREINFLILTDPQGGEAWLTNQSTASSYGIPVLQITADDIDGDFGPADLIDGTSVGGNIFPAANIVASWAQQPGRTTQEIEAARLYLSQWPPGPQV